ncbi:hypothetical protein R3W88_033394 [Solanum pinnatisectum]|uniref:RNase H type-1 domain-containing protein n=1 Tax=Solanum pinnatisectum TaxID=50273 RepID=A0AAV9K2W9_9SOLN|nr:hypothetical protein R3W88_033394 [Solanum pinnatisectum]
MFTTIQHTSREGNHVADRLANYGGECTCTEWFSTLQQLLMEARGGYNTDRLEFPCFRRKQNYKTISVERSLERTYTFDVP